MTSPARLTTTVSPILSPNLSISSALCSEAWVMVTPPTRTGRMTATGVSAPVRPTWIFMSSTTVAASRAANL